MILTRELIKLIKENLLTIDILEFVKNSRDKLKETIYFREYNTEDDLLLSIYQLKQKEGLMLIDRINKDNFYFNLKQLFEVDSYLLELLFYLIYGDSKQTASEVLTNLNKRNSNKKIEWLEMLEAPLEFDYLSLRSLMFEL